MCLWSKNTPPPLLCKDLLPSDTGPEAWALPREGLGPPSAPELITRGPGQAAAPCSGFISALQVSGSNFRTTLQTLISQRCLALGKT